MAVDDWVNSLVDNVEREGVNMLLILFRGDLDPGLFETVLGRAVDVCLPAPPAVAVPGGLDELDVEEAEGVGTQTVKLIVAERDTTEDKDREADSLGLLEGVPLEKVVNEGRGEVVSAAVGRAFVRETESSDPLGVRVPGKGTPLPSVGENALDMEGFDESVGGVDLVGSSKEGEAVGESVGGGGLKEGEGELELLKVRVPGCDLEAPSKGEDDWVPE